jgi:hypothetical protein
VSGDASSASASQWENARVEPFNGRPHEASLNQEQTSNRLRWSKRSLLVAWGRALDSRRQRTAISRDCGAHRAGRSASFDFRVVLALHRSDTAPF